MGEHGSPAHGPPLVLLVGQQAVQEADEPHHRSKEQHLCVEAQPGKVDPDLLSIILPVNSREQRD